MAGRRASRPRDPEGYACVGRPKTYPLPTIWCFWNDLPITVMPMTPSDLSVCHSRDFCSTYCVFEGSDRLCFDSFFLN